MASDAPAEGGLRRRLGLSLLTFWGVGTIVGGGFYALIGEVAAEAGLLTPVAFLVAAAIAGLSALSFAELSARMPFSAGEAHYVLEAFGRRGFSALVGWGVITTGVVSAATLANAFARFVRTVVDVPGPAAAVTMILVLGAVAGWGIAESVLAAAVVTVIETGGLLLVVAMAGDRLGELGSLAASGGDVDAAAQASGVLLGAFVAFYAFVGFEDMVNLAEEVRAPERTMPRGILLSLGITTLLYVVVTLVVVVALPQAELVGSHTPLSDVVRGQSPAVAQGLTFVGMLAGLNGALVQIVMAARVAYGMASKHQAPASFARVHPKTGTPLFATAAATAVVIAAALFFPLVTLAKMTSGVLLLIYTAVNLALYRLKGREGWARGEGPTYPRWVPALGALLSLSFVLFQLGALLP